MSTTFILQFGECLKVPWRNSSRSSPRRWRHEIGRASVGRECRSRCDGSPDVCASDLREYGNYVYDLYPAVRGVLEGPLEEFESFIAKKMAARDRKSVGRERV